MSSFDNQNSFWFDFFHQFDMLLRDENNRDYHEFKYKQLLIEHFSFWILSLVKSEAKFFRNSSLTQFITNRKYDIDSFQALITTLKIFRQVFSFCYLSFYFQRITQNLKIDIEKMTSHKIKQLRIDSDVNDVDMNFHVHVLFSHWSMSFRVKITHLSQTKQIIWIDNIVFSTFRVFCDNNVLTKYSRFYQQICDIDNVKFEVHVNCFERLISLKHHISQKCLINFWEHVFQNVNARAKFESSKYEKRWQNSLLFLFDHNFKCFIKRIINRNATRAFENLLNNCYDWQSAHMSKENVWMNFEVENFSHCFETFSIILLWKRSCLKKWVKLFHDS